jgi:hypothetical protein
MSPEAATLQKSIWHHRRLNVVVAFLSGRCGSCLNGAQAEGMVRSGYRKLSDWWKLLVEITFSQERSSVFAVRPQH